MKQNIIRAVKDITEDRQVTAYLAVFLLLCLVTVIFLLTQIHPSELQVVIHYTSFGPTNFYRDKWFYLLTFVGFMIVLAVVHSAVAYRMLQKKGRELTIAFLWLSIAFTFISVSLFHQVLKIASLS